MTERHERWPLEKFDSDRHRQVFDELVARLGGNGSIRFDSDTLGFDVDEPDSYVVWIARIVTKMENQLRGRISERLLTEATLSDWEGQVSGGFLATMLQIVGETE